MSALETRIKELVAFARSRDGEDRTLLFRNLVDLFIAGRDTIKNPSRRQLVDVIEALIPHVDADMRRSVAETLSVFPNPPMDLIAALAKDRASLVSPLLRKAPFDEDQLVDLVGATGREHHHEISTRSDLTANVWIALARAAPEAPVKRPHAADLWRVEISDPSREGRAQARTNAATQAPSVNASLPFANNSAQQTQNIADADSTRTHTSQSEAISPKVTLLHPKRKENRTLARLRILRTDEDLISERMAQEALDIPMMEGSRLAASGHASIQTVPTRSSLPPRVPVQTTEDAAISESETTPARPTLSDMVSRAPTNSTSPAETQPHASGITESTPTTDTTEPDAQAQESAAPTAQAAQAAQAAPAAEAAQVPVHRAPSVSNFQDAQRLKSPISDPGQGGWAWRSDRDGFVTAVSPQAGEILRKASSHLVGEAMLDLLGLNTKLGHPIARALQRRSAIHDAPVYLSHFDKDRRYWTLDAHPLFNARSGAFEGYEGMLMPVNAYAQDHIDAGYHDEDDLFLPESRNHTPHPENAAPSENTENSGHSEQFERPLAPAATQQDARLHTSSNARTNHQAPHSALPVEGLLDDLHSMVSEQTTDLVRKIMGGAFASLNGTSMAATDSTEEHAAHSRAAPARAQASATDPLALSWRALQDELRNQLPSQTASHAPQQAHAQTGAQTGAQAQVQIRQSAYTAQPPHAYSELHGHAANNIDAALYATDKGLPNLQASDNIHSASAHANPASGHAAFDANNTVTTGIDMSRLTSLAGQPNSGTTSSAHRSQANTAPYADEAHTSLAHPQQRACPPTPTNATLQALEASITQLIAESRSSGNVSLRLQAEMAAACLKVLKEQVLQ